MVDRLPWDSEFFGFGVGKANLSDIIHVTPGQLKNELLQRGFRLVYIFHHISNDSGIHDQLKNRYFKDLGARLADTKMVFEKKLHSDTSAVIEENIHEYNEMYPTDQLYSLALQSGEYSRYRLDNNFPAGSFERMYKQWMDNSLNGQMADKVLVSYKDDFINGMVTLSLKSGIASIGLIAVDEQARGQKIGKKLVDAVIVEATNSGMTYLSVATQKNNFAASGFYRKSGFYLKSETEIYHLWI